MADQADKHLVRRLNKLYDGQATREEYFKIVVTKKSRGTFWDDQWDRAQVQEMISHIKSNRDDPGQKFDLAKENGVDVLILKRTVGPESRKLYRKVLVMEDSYDILSKAHRELGHAGYKEIFMKLKRRWNFPIAYVTALMSSCNVCRILKNIQFLEKDFEAASDDKEVWRLNVINVAMECPYILTPKYILVCEDIFSEFLILRPMTENSVDEMSNLLSNIFFQFGAPKTILANPVVIYEALGSALKNIAKNHPDFSVKTEIKDTATIIRNCDVIDALKLWISDVESTNYEIDCELGCHVVQRKLNTLLRVTNTRWNPTFKAFVPHNLYMRYKELPSHLWDDDVIQRLIEKEPIINKRKRKINK